MNLVLFIAAGGAIGAVDVIDDIAYFRIGQGSIGDFIKFAVHFSKNLRIRLDGDV